MLKTFTMFVPYFSLPRFPFNVKIGFWNSDFARGILQYLSISYAWKAKRSRHPPGMGQNRANGVRHPSKVTL